MQPMKLDGRERYERDLEQIPRACCSEPYRQIALLPRCSGAHFGLGVGFDCAGDSNACDTVIALLLCTTRERTDPRV
jgi:hypothetical protein